MKILNGLTTSSHESARPGHIPSRKPHRNLIKNILKIVVCGLVIAILGAGVIIIHLLVRLGISPLDPGTLSGDAGGRVNIIVLGVGDPGHDGQNLSDTIMVISLDQTSQTAAMLSIPRDLRVSIPGYYFAKINQANALGGPVLAEQTVSNTLNLPINYYMVANFSALSQLVDAVGGLDVAVKYRLSDPGYPCANDQYRSCGLDIKAGNYIMNGATVLEYTRCRKGTCGNDFGRAERQQQIVALLKQKLLTPAVYLDPIKLEQLVGIIRTNLKTDMSTNNLIRLVWELKHSHPITNSVLSTSPGGLLVNIPGSSDLAPSSGDLSQIQDYANNIFTAPSLPQP